MAFAGCALTAGAVQGGGIGVWLVLLSAFLYSVFMLLGSRFAAHLPAEATASHTAQAAAAFCIPYALLQGTAWLPPSPRAWGSVFAIAAVCTVVASARPALGHGPHRGRARGGAQLARGGGDDGPGRHLPRRPARGPVSSGGPP